MPLKMHLYRRLADKQDKILGEVSSIPDRIGIPRDLRNEMGLSGKISGIPAPLRRDIREAIGEITQSPIALANLAEELRVIVKDFYGDEYDALAMSTCEATLRVAFEALFVPPMGRGDSYVASYIAPYEHYMHHQGAFGRPFPPKYKDYVADHGVTSGELGMLGKRQENVATIVVPLVGARYDCHGIKYFPCPLMLHVDPELSHEAVTKVAARHASTLVGITSLGYDTPGFGYGERDSEGTPVIQKLYSRLAQEYNVPYIIDNAAAAPFTGTDIRRTGADLVLYSTDKALGAPIGGLIIGKEEVMVPLRRALGTHSSRNGSLSYGKASHVGFDPGVQSLAGIIAALKAVRTDPTVLTDAVDRTYDIVIEEMASLDAEVAEYCMVTKTYNRLEVEVNYQDSWTEQRIGFPIFTMEDMYAGTNLVGSAMRAMGLIPTVSQNANMVIVPGQGTTDERGRLIEERMRWCVRALFRALEVIERHWKADN